MDSDEAGQKANRRMTEQLEADGLTVILVVGILDQKNAGVLLEETIPMIVVGSSDGDKNLLAHKTTPFGDLHLLIVCTVYQRGCPKILSRIF